MANEAELMKLVTELEAQLERKSDLLTRACDVIKGLRKRISDLEADLDSNGALH